MAAFHPRSNHCCTLNCRSYVPCPRSRLWGRRDSPRSFWARCGVAGRVSNSRAAVGCCSCGWRWFGAAVAMSDSNWNENFHKNHHIQMSITLVSRLRTAGWTWERIPRTDHFRWGKRDRSSLGDKSLSVENNWESANWSGLHYQSQFVIQTTSSSIINEFNQFCVNIHNRNEKKR